MGGGCKPIPVPPSGYKGTLAEWSGLTPDQQYNKQYSIVHAVKLATSKKATRDKIKHTAAFKQKRAESVRRWSLAHPGRAAAMTKAGKAKIKHTTVFKQKAIASSKKWRAKNMEKSIENGRKYRIKKEREFYEMFGPMGII